MNIRNSLFMLSLCIILQACAGGLGQAPKELLTLSDAQMKLRSYQTRSFDLNDENKVLKGVVASLQDLGFIVERANGPMGMVTAGKFGPNGVGFVELTVTVRTKGEKQTEVRVNAIYNTKPIEDPKIYQNFFAAVERSLFIAQ